MTPLCAQYFLKRHHIDLSVHFWPCCGIGKDVIQVSAWALVPHGKHLAWIQQGLCCLHGVHLVLFLVWKALWSPLRLVGVLG